MDALNFVRTLTFDAFGTILDLGGSHASRIGEFIKKKGLSISVESLWDRWRQRQRIEQFQDNLFYSGHFGYLDSCRRSLTYALRAAKIPFDNGDITQIMEGWHELNTFPDSTAGLQRLRNKFQLVVLSNGENDYLAQVVKNRIRVEFDAVLSVEDVGVFKPNPQVYRYAARILKADPQELMMVSAHSFDAVGARASGYQTAYVNRYDLPYDETPYQFDVEAKDFVDLADKLHC